MASIITPGTLGGVIGSLVAQNSFREPPVFPQRTAEQVIAINQRRQERFAAHPEDYNFIPPTPLQPPIITPPPSVCERIDRIAYYILIYTLGLAFFAICPIGATICFAAYLIKIFYDSRQQRSAQPVVQVIMPPGAIQHILP